MVRLRIMHLFIIFVCSTTSFSQNTYLENIHKYCNYRCHLFPAVPSLSQIDLELSDKPKSVTSVVGNNYTFKHGLCI